jgi:hypothetical protein
MTTALAFALFWLPPQPVHMVRNYIPIIERSMSTTACISHATLPSHTTIRVPNEHTF